MFEKCELCDDQGDIVIRAFHQSKMIVAIINSHDLPISSALDFVRSNQETFLAILWEKYVGGYTTDEFRAGSQFKKADITFDDISAAKDSFTPFVASVERG